MSAKDYHGSCHCGAVAFEVSGLDLDKAVTCNCSRCQRVASVLAFVPRSQFTLKSGADSLTEYRFNRKVIAHQFCKTCGIQCFSYGEMPDGTQTVAINVNVLDGVEPRALTPEHVDGRSY